MLQGTLASHKFRIPPHPELEHAFSGLKYRVPGEYFVDLQVFDGVGADFWWGRGEMEREPREMVRREKVVGRERERESVSPHNTHIAKRPTSNRIYSADIKNDLQSFIGLIQNIDTLRL